MQTVGETGWLLSQGERSRVFLARALLQEAEVVVLDETPADSLRAQAEAAVKYCPTRALSIVEIDRVVAEPDTEQSDAEQPETEQGEP